MTKTSKLSPKVSVIMPVYNVEKYLKRSIDSVLSQEFEDFEVIAINDGSTDSSSQILDSLAARDSRIKAIHQRNQGLVATLNKAIAISNGKYIARMDSDDYSMPLRFERQVEMLDSNPELILVGGSFELIDEDDVYLQREALPFRSKDLKRRLLLRNPFAHGSTMFRREPVLTVGGYSDKVGPTEDLDLWIKLSDLGEFAAINGVSYRWRVNRYGISSTKNQEQQAQRNTLLSNYLDRKIEEIDITTRSELINTSKDYLKASSVLGLYIKIGYLYDNAQIAFKLIRKKKIIQGTRQLINVASTGRTGLKIVAKKILHFNIMGVSEYEDTTDPQR